MKRAYVLAAFGAVVGCFAMAACSGDDSTGPTGGKTDTGVGSDTSTPGDDTGTDTETSTEDTGGTTTEAGTPTCPAVLNEGKIAELRDPASPKKVKVNDGIKLKSVVATSQRFLTGSTSPAVGGPCLYGVFVADANATFEPYSGMLVVYYGKNAVARDGGTGGVCPTAGDDTILIPADTKPGDVFDISGTYTEFGPTAATCAGAKPTGLPPPIPGKMPELFKVCAITRTSTGGTVPAPADVAPTDIAQQTGDGANLLKWAGGLVRLTDVKAGSALDTYGTFTIEGSALPVKDKIYYRGASTAPFGISAGTEFTSITGLSYLDFCSWLLAPSKCTDMVPKTGTVCPGG